MFVLGLTGSIGMGKSSTAAMFREEGIPVHDSDAVVHALYKGGAAPLIEAAFPGTVREGVVDRGLLGARVLDDPAALARLEAIVHPLVAGARHDFLADAAQKGARLVVLDIPLLFETGLDREVDAVVLVSAPETVQKERVGQRPGMTPERLAVILGRQMPDTEKRTRAHFIIDTGRGFDAARQQVRGILRTLAGAPGRY
ncbi:dephospho-CoA kinase [Methylocapsa sp. D3K7]|uniref:dephospho-CoA kinase n=1 Tax=Methylocapsa sp. D3K7 TaxID=3041435 RepID=UPI00244EFBAD|nr:dephospho-CoA kinase [Methylocapsa sp. D3K7]WGJ13453.1 dephospho-CoA kinase [Methylocapsa sp. D3K7]